MAEDTGDKFLEVQMDDLEQTEIRTKVEIDPDGNVLLLLDGLELKVFSKVLSLASRVFKAMFSSHYAEGNELKEHSFCTFCSPTHHQSLRRS